MARLGVRACIRLGEPPSFRAIIPTKFTTQRRILHGRHRNRSIHAPEGKTREELAAAFEQSAPLYRDVPGLVRKYYLVSEDLRTGGGSICSSRAPTPSGSTTDAWWARLRERMGVEPNVEYFDSPVIVDNGVGATAS